MLKLLNRIRWMLFFVLALFFMFMCSLALYRHAWATPLPKLTLQRTLILTGLAAVEFLLISLLYKFAVKLPIKSERCFITLVLLFYTAIQVAFILLFPVGAYEDALIVERLAKEFLSGNYTSLGIGKYLGYYPNNIGITLFFAFLYVFLPNSVITLRICNALFNTASLWLIYKLYRELHPGDSKKARGILLLGAFFLPAIIMNNFTYGDIVCNTFCLGAVLYAVKFVKSHRFRFAVYTSILLMAGNFLRSITLLFLVAILAYWMIHLVLYRKAYKNSIVGILLASFIFGMPLQLFSQIGVKNGMLQEPVGIHANPVWRWINIGFPAGYRLGYWDGGRNCAIFVRNFKCEPKAASKFFIQDILEKYRESGRINTLKAYVKKTFWLWTEGTYSVNFYGLSQAVKSDDFMLYSTPLIKYIEPQDLTVRHELDWLLHSCNWLLLLLTAVTLFRSAKRRDYRQELYVYLIFMYIGFYLIWEIKSRYLFGLYPFLLLMAYESITSIYHKRIRPKK